MNTLRVLSLLAVILAAAPAAARAAALVDTDGEFGPEPESAVRTVPFEVTATGCRLVLQASAALEEGKVTIRVVDPAGETIRSYGTGGSMTISRHILGPLEQTGTFRVEVVPEAAVGTWSVRICELPDRWALWPYLIPGPGMMLVGVVAAVYWWRRSRVRWRWLWVGAAVWAVGVALKVGWSILLDVLILSGLEGALPYGAYVATGSVYFGLQTGVFEIGVTLAAALIWRRMAADANRAVAVGVGAGAFEALLVGVGPLVSAVAALSGVEGSDRAAASLMGASVATPLVWLVGPVERILVVLCHTSSRALVLLGVARQRWSLFWWGFLLMTGLDAVAGWAHVSGQVGRISFWWLELAILPFAVVSIPIIAWCIRTWPAQEAPTETPQEV
ncbi:MAG TPA: YhfC family glutamic-type intramembrane protease [Phycisphaerae bacterium]|nr:YhfC family glutamic-type intramembrane protease [Phycisphaerae bacterium]HUU91255.1 YhfC family glutamic-type intramembrane protease [Phycisphaerae bacterium]